MSLRQSEAIAALSAALAAAFRADQPLMALTDGRIHDGAPRAPVSPYLALADARGRDFSDGDDAGARVQVLVEAVTADEERGRAVAILDRAVELALAPPPLGTGRIVLIRLETTAVARARDGRGWRASAALDVLVEG
jgi:hypothetical protein